MERVGVLVQRVRGHRARGETRTFHERVHVEVVLPQAHEQPVGGRGNGAGGAAFDGLRGVPGQTGVGAPQVGQGGEERGVAGPAGQDDVAAFEQGLLDRLDAHHGHGVAAGEDVPVDRRGMVEGADPTLVPQPLEPLGGLVGVDQTQLETQALRRRDGASQTGDPVDTGIAAAGAARTDDQWHAEPVAPFEQESQVAGDGLPGKLRDARAEGGRAAVGRSGITRDHMRAGGQAPLERLGIEPGAEHSGGGENSDLHAGVSPSR